MERARTGRRATRSASRRRSARRVRRSTLPRPRTQGSAKSGSGRSRTRASARGALHSFPVLAVVLSASLTRFTARSWAFVDFHLPAQATRALLNLHNHQLNGRKLNVEYASAEAVRRGAVGTKSGGGGGGGGRGNAGPRRRGPREEGEEGEAEDEERGAGGKKRREREWDDTDVKALAGQAGGESGYGGPPPRAQRGPRPQRDDARKGGREDGGGAKRPKPGAALAMAQRASEGIVQSTGKKITFD